MEKIAEHRCFGGRQLRYRHQSQALNCSMQVSVFLPPQAKSAKVPVLYWLSGLTCSDENFVQKAGAQQFAARYGVAIVAPETSPRGGNAESIAFFGFLLVVAADSVRSFGRNGRLASRPVTCGLEPQRGQR